MRYRALGETNLSVSIIGIGTWQLGGEWGRSYSQVEADAIFDQAAALGINLIDTAECYGDHTAEKLVGDYLARHDRPRWIVATKFGHHFRSFMKRDDAFSCEAVRRQLDASLRALRVECIDLYQFHSGSDAAFQDDALWAMLDAEKRAGKIGHLGISILGKGSQLQARQARGVGAEALQVVYNRLDRRPEQLYFPDAQRDRLGILARVPLASGLLSGKYRPGAEFAGNDVRAHFDQEKMRNDIAEAARLQEKEVPPGVPMAQWALAWCLSNPLVSAVIPGCKDPAQVISNAAAADLLAA
ncbi:MAG TPA: aldo/keto reductase [Candidatus Baltobacteraceae bacterium]|jgi:aryl-alcohol dehydrogenase-like predicted oxidoreductase|nr:aldo/keto reductase [Candidatus Baltobacteraceae bacterium]